MPKHEEEARPLISCHFVISGRDFDPKECTEELGLEPAEVWKQNRPDLARVAVLNTAEWSVGLAKRPADTIEEVISAVTEQVWEARSRIKEFVQRRHLAATLVCSVTIVNYPPKYALSRELLAKLGQLGCAFALNIYDYS